MKTSNRTPYEIRLELLQLAQTILTNKYKASQIAEYSYDLQPPTVEEIIIEAEKLNVFVSKANTPH